MWFFDFLSENGNILEEKNLWRPQSPDIKINLEYSDIKLLQAWEYEWNWYYNYLWALNEVRYLGKKLSSKEEFEKSGKQKIKDIYVNEKQLTETLRVNGSMGPLDQIIKNTNQLINTLPLNGTYIDYKNITKNRSGWYWCKLEKSTYSWNLYEELYKLWQEWPYNPFIVFWEWDYSIIPLDNLSIWLSVRCLKN